MKCIINEQVTLSNPPEGPLTEYIKAFADYVGRQGYSLKSTQSKVYLVAQFSHWLNKRHVALRDITRNHADRFLQGRNNSVRRGQVATLKLLFDYLKAEGVTPKSEECILNSTPSERYIKAYEQYLSDERGLAKATISNYVPYVILFLKDCYGGRKVKLSLLSAEDIVRFVERQAPRLHDKRAKLMTAALRSFFKYARYRGDVTLDLAAAVPIVPNWSMPSIPRDISPEQVQRLLASIDRETAIGRRDYAILLLFARLGLRVSEVTFLKLEDINWNDATLKVHGKGNLFHEFPLSLEVGKAIADYLQNERPQSTSRRVFLRSKAPTCGFYGPSGIDSMVRHSLQRAGISAPTYGAHQFRHGLATDLLRHGASLGEIGDVLGHQALQSTTIYAKVDIEALRLLAQPWPGGAL